MASQIPGYSQRPLDGGWGLAGAGRLVSSVFQRGYSYLANLSSSLAPFFFTQNVQQPSIGLNRGLGGSVLETHSFQVNPSDPPDLRLVSGLISPENLPEPIQEQVEENETDSIRKVIVVEDEQEEDSTLWTLLDTAVKTDVVAQEKLKEPWGLVTGPSAEFIYFMSDISSTYRMVDTLVATIRNQTVPVGNSGLGITSGASILTGYISGCRGYVENEKANKIHDFWGKICAKVTMVRGAIEAAGGAVFIPVRALSIVAAKTNSVAVTQSAMVLGNVGSGLFGLTYLLVAIPSAIVMGKGISFSLNLKKAMEHPALKTKREQLRAGIEFLLHELGLVRSECKKLAYQTVKDPHIWDGKDVKPVELSEADEKLLSDYEHAYINSFIEAYGRNHDYSPSILMQIGEHIKLAFINAKKLKETELQRKAGTQTVALVKEEIAKSKAEQLIERLLDPEDVTAIADAEKLLNQVKANTNFNIGFNAVIIFLCVLGAVAFFAGMAGSGGTLGIVLAVFWVIIAVGMIGIDGYCLAQAFKQGDPKFKDKLIMSIMGLFMTAAVLLGTVFSGGLVPLIAAGVIGLIWIGFSGYSYYRWSNQPPKEDKVETTARRKIDILREEEKKRLHEAEVRKFLLKPKVKLA